MHNTHTQTHATCIHFYAPNTYAKWTHSLEAQHLMCMYVQNCKSLIAYFSVIGSSLSSHILMACSPLSFHFVCYYNRCAVCTLCTEYAVIKWGCMVMHKMPVISWCHSQYSCSEMLQRTAPSQCYIHLSSPFAHSLYISHLLLFKFFFFYFRAFLFPLVDCSFFRCHFIWHSIFHAYHRMASFTWNGIA